jgi:hypothetical protein
MFVKKLGLGKGYAGPTICENGSSCSAVTIRRGICSACRNNRFGVTCDRTKNHLGGTEDMISRQRLNYIR